MVAIRPPTSEDIPQIAELDKEVFTSLSYPGVVIRQLYEVAGPLLNLAVDGPHIVGYAMVLPTVTAGEGWFMSLAVTSRFRNRGVGRTLLEYTLDRCHEFGLLCIWLTVAPANSCAFRLYTSLGFVEHDRIANYFGDGEDRILLARVASGPAGSGCDAARASTGIAMR